VTSFVVLDDPLVEGWPTQIGLWAAFGKISKNIDFLKKKLWKNTQNIEKSASFNSKLGRRNSFLATPALVIIFLLLSQWKPIRNTEKYSLENSKALNLIFLCCNFLSSNFNIGG
jgi:hypothetical protein